MSDSTSSGSFRKPFFAEFGSVSSGTMRPEDLIPVFVDLLSELNDSRSLHYSTSAAFRNESPDRELCEDAKREHDRVTNLLADIESRMYSGDEFNPDYWDSEDAYYDLNETLFDELQVFAPPLAYFGSHPGDGADYGFWLTDDLDCFGGLAVNDRDRDCEYHDLSDIPADYVGEVLHVNDHGNVTLYVQQDGELHELWALV